MSKRSMQVTLVRLRVEGLVSFAQALMIASVLPWLPRGGHTYPSGAVVYAAAVLKPLSSVSSNQPSGASQLLERVSPFMADGSRWESWL